MGGMQFLNRKPASLVHDGNDGGNFQQGVAQGVESRGFNVDDDRQIAAKTFGNMGCIGVHRHNGDFFLGKKRLEHFIYWHMIV